MNAHIDLQIASTENAIPDSEAFTLWVNRATASHRPDAEVSIRIVDEPESQELNSHYRNKSKPTNVLSFPADFPEGVTVNFIGDLVICASVVGREAVEQNKELRAHWAHMVIHGTLHLLGYDHIEEDEATRMESLETQLLAELGYPCPYED